jgi:hypothetical protein
VVGRIVPVAVVVARFQGAEARVLEIGGALVELRRQLFARRVLDEEALAPVAAPEVQASNLGRGPRARGAAGWAAAPQVGLPTDRKLVARTRANPASIRMKGSSGSR